MCDELSHLAPLIAGWFRDTYEAATEIQRLAWPSIDDGENVLITAPTGSGKTLTAFLSAISRLITGEWERGTTRVLYVSPLKALNNDIQRNLLAPLAALKVRAEELGEALPQINVATRSGDTPSSERQRMIRKPPEILITTPESLNLILSLPRASSMLRGIKTVILDEVHAIITGKRGTHLITAVDRIVSLAGEFQRIAISATVRPLDVVAAFVGGYRIVTADDNRGGEVVYEPRKVRTVAAPSAKKLEITVEYPVTPLAERTVRVGTAGGEGASGLTTEGSAGKRRAAIDPGIWSDLTAAFLEIIERNRSTLFFVTTRRHAEKITLLLNEELEEPVAYSHHGSLSRELRYFVEQELKAGRLKAIVATSSLELGIDVGELDEVVLVKAPGSVASVIQRVGRAGHRVGVASRGRIVPLAGRDFIEAAVVARAALDGQIEEVRPTAGPLDLLAQIIISMLAGGAKHLDDLFAELRTSYPYHQLERRQFDLVVEMLAGRYAQTQIRELRPRVAIDAIDGTIHLREGALRLLYQSGGTIPDRGQYIMRMAGSGAKIGELDEEFVWEHKVGEHFVFGSSLWTVTEIGDRDVLVVPASKVNQLVPFWRAENQSRDFHFAARILEFLERADSDLGAGEEGRDSLAKRLAGEHVMDTRSAEATIELLEKQRSHTRVSLPHRHHLIIEHCIDPNARSDTQELILHTGWGGRVNHPFSVALSAAWEEQFGYQLETFADDDCILVHLPHEVAARTLLAPRFLERLRSEAQLTSLLRKRLENSALFGGIFRESAGRALLLPKPGFNKRMPLWLNRIRSKKLLAAVHGYDDFPILLETWRSCLQEVFDLPTLSFLVDEILVGTITVSECETYTPSPLARTMVWQQTNVYMYHGDELASPRSSNLSEELMREVLHSARLRPRIAAQHVDALGRRLARCASGYAPESALEYVDWVREHLVIPGEEAAELRSLAGLSETDLAEHAHRLRTIDRGGSQLVITAEVAERMKWLGDVAGAPEREELKSFLGEWLRFYGPQSVSWIAKTLGVSDSAVSEAVAELVEAGSVVIGTLVDGDERKLLCDAQNLEMLLRRQRRARTAAVEPRPLALLVPLIAAQTQFGTNGGEADSLPQVIDRLVGYPAPASLWEGEILPARFDDYFPIWLDGLFAGEQLLWIGTGKERLTLALDADLPLLQAGEAEDAGVSIPQPLEPGRGYEFWELAEYWNLDSSELTELLWSLSWSGRITNDRFETVRSGIAAGFQSTPAAAAGTRAPDLPTPRRTATRGARAGYARWKSTRPMEGRWYAVAQPQELSPIETRELEKERARLLLARYGVVFRELLDRELPNLRWSAVFRALRLMELAGEVVSGPFFEGPTGVQFALPDIAERLAAAADDDLIRLVNAADPASPSGLGIDCLPPEIPARIASNHLVYAGSRLLLVSRRSGKELTIVANPDEPVLVGGLKALGRIVSRRWSPQRRIVTESINDEPTRESIYAPVLEAAGFGRGYRGYTLQASYH